MTVNGAISTDVNLSTLVPISFVDRVKLEEIQLQIKQKQLFARFNPFNRGNTIKMPESSQRLVNGVNKEQVLLDITLPSGRVVEDAPFFVVEESGGVMGIGYKHMCEFGLKPLPPSSNP